MAMARKLKFTLPAIHNGEAEALKAHELQEDREKCGSDSCGAQNTCGGSDSCGGHIPR